MFKIISKKRYDAMMDELKSNQTKITEAEQERLRIVDERNDALRKQQAAENDAKEKAEKIEAQRIELSKLNEKVICLQQELDGRKPKRSPNGRFTSKKAKKESE